MLHKEIVLQSVMISPCVVLGVECTIFSNFLKFLVILKLYVITANAVVNFGTTATAVFKNTANEVSKKNTANEAVF